LGEAHVRVIRGFLNGLPCWVDAPTREHAEAQLAHYATQYRPELLAKLAAKLAEVLNPDGEFSDEDRARRRGLSLGVQDRDGMCALRGWLTPAARAALEAVLAKLAAPGMANPHDPQPVLDGAPSPEAIERDTRSAAQRKSRRVACCGARGAGFWGVGATQRGADQHCGHHHPAGAGSRHRDRADRRRHPAADE
jgi:hypothetical protein